MSALRTIHGHGTCARHGSFEYTAYQVGRSLVGSSCPRCLSEGQERAHFANEQRAADERVRRHEERLARAQVPLAFRDATFDTFQHVNEAATKVASVVRRTIDAFDKVLATRPTSGMVFVGNPGTGKTHLACAAIERLLASGYSAMYVSAPALLLALREATYGRAERSSVAMISELATPHLLVMDEYGTHTTTDIDYQFLFTIVDERYRNNVPTLLVSNSALTAPRGRAQGGAPESDDDIDPAKREEMDVRFMRRVRGNVGPILSFNWSPPRRLAK